MKTTDSKIDKLIQEKSTDFLFKNHVVSYEKILDDHYHAIKRNTGFAWFDRLLSDCKKGKCPAYISEDNFYKLIDLSLEGYILQKAYHFHGAKVGDSDQARYFKAFGRIDTIFSCKINTTIDPRLFRRDTRKIYYKRKEYHSIYHSARLRRAYWMYLKDSPNNDPYTDYFTACTFIDDIHRIYNKHTCTKEDCDAYKEKLLGNRHIATPVDLYRYCLLRSKVKP